MDEPASKIGLSCVRDVARAWDILGPTVSFRRHWPEYLMEAGEVTLYLFFTCCFATILQHPASPVSHFVTSGIVRRALMGFAVGATVVAIIMSPWGKQSGGHINPAMTVAFYRLGKVARWDASFYGAAQFLGAISGVAMATLLLRGAPGDGAVRYAVTAGVYGSAVAFAAELAISFFLMITVLLVTNHQRLAPYTPYFVGSLYAVNITFETPLSGMSMNPARTFGPAVYSGYWHALWIYFVAPTLGMLAAAAIFLWTRHSKPSYCAKLRHVNNKRCIFNHAPSEERAVIGHLAAHAIRKAQTE